MLNQVTSQTGGVRISKRDAIVDHKWNFVEYPVHTIDSTVFDFESLALAAIEKDMHLKKTGTGAFILVLDVPFDLEERDKELQKAVDFFSAYTYKQKKVA